MEDSLIDLGLSKNAARVYLALLEIGKTSIAKIVDKTELHPQLIYNALEELEKIELAAHTVERGRRYFQPGAPSVLVQMQQEKLGKAEQVLPNLLAKYQHGEQQMVWIYSGDEDFRKAREKVVRSIPKGGYYYVIGSGGKQFLRAMEGTFRESETNRIKRGIYKRVIDFRDTQEYQDPIQEENLAEYRILDTEAGPTSTLFGGDYLRINIWTEPVVTILIKNKTLVETYTRYFEFLWSIGKPTEK